MSDNDDFVAAAARASDHSYLAPEVVRQRMRTLELLAPRAGERVLDAGCGVGLLSEPIAREVGGAGELVGVDVTPDVLAKARARCADLPNATFLEGGVESLPVEDGRFDAAACTQVLLYVRDVPRALAELHRALGPGGRLVVVETDWSGLVLGSDDTALTREIVAGLSKAVASPDLPPRLVPMLAGAGFRAVRVEALPILRTSMTPDDFAYATLEWFAHTAPQHTSVSERRARKWLEGLNRLQREGAFFFCVNRFLFSAVKV